MACQIIFELPDGKELKIQTDLEEEDFLHPESFNYTESELKLINTFDDSINKYIPEDQLDLIAHALINYSGSDKSLILSQLSEVELSNDVVTFGDSGVLVSNISGDRLRSLFPKIDFSKNIPPVLLIPGNGSIIKQGDVYIVPKNKIEQFARFTLELDALKLFKSGTIENTRANEIFDQVQRQLNGSKVAKDLDKNTRDIQEAIQKAISNREHKKDEDGDNLVSLRSKLEKWNNEYDELSINIYRTKEGSQNNQQIKDKMIALERKIRFATQKILDIEEEIRKIENFEIIPNKKLEDLINKRNTLVEAKDILCRYVTTFDQFIDNYIHNRELWNKNLDDLTKESIQYFLEEITDTKKAYKIGDNFIDTISRTLFKENAKNNKFRISVIFASELLKQKGFNTDNLTTSQIHSLLLQEYSDKQDLFKINDLKSENQQFISFTKQHLPNLFQGPITVEQRQQFVADHILDNTYKGYYITKINNYYIISDRPVNQYSKGHKYATREEAISAIEISLNNKKIVASGKNYLNAATENISTIELPSSNITYRRGEILSTLDIPVGPIKPNIDIKYDSVLKVIESLKSDSDPVLKQLGYRLSTVLDSPQKAGIALSHFKLLDPVTKYSYYTLNTINLINSILDKIENAQINYFVVTSDSVVQNGKNYVSIMRVSREQLTKPKEIDYTIDHTPNVLLLEAISQTLSKYGLNIEIVTNDEMREISGTDLNKGYLKDGIIYLNRDTATAQDLLHEHTHILLGLLKNQNLKAFTKVLLEFKDKYSNKEEFNQIFNDKMMIYADDIAQISDSQERELFILEEMFADSFADYLLGKNDLNDIFTKIEKGLNSHPLFEGKTYDLKGKSLNDLFKGFLSEVKSAYQNLGFGFPTSKKVYNQLDAAIKKYTKDIDAFDETKHLIKRDCK